MCRAFCHVPESDPPAAVQTVQIPRSYFKCLWTLISLADPDHSRSCGYGTVRTHYNTGDHVILLVLKAFCLQGAQVFQTGLQLTSNLNGGCRRRGAHTDMNSKTGNHSKSQIVLLQLVSWSQLKSFLRASKQRRLFCSLAAAATMNTSVH
jgi:hypothetical protein